MRLLPGAALLAALLLTTPAGAADVTITQKDRVFSPADVTVHVGDTLIFVNADPVKHNVHSPTEGFVFDLDVQRPGDSSRRPVTRRGTFDVQCYIHPKMKLKVRVVP